MKFVSFRVIEDNGTCVTLIIFHITNPSLLITMLTIVMSPIVPYFVEFFLAFGAVHARDLELSLWLLDAGPFFSRVLAVLNDSRHLRHGSERCGGCWIGLDLL